MLCRDRKLHRFKTLLKPDLSTASESLQVISASELTPYDLKHLFLQSCRICEDTLVSLLVNDYQSSMSSIYGINVQSFSQHLLSWLSYSQDVIT